MADELRESMVVYRSFYEAIKHLPKEDQADTWAAIFEYGLNFEEIQLEGIPKTIFTLVKPQIQSNIKKYFNGKVDKTKERESKPEAKDKQNESKPEGNVSVSGNVSENGNAKVNDFDNRKLKFASTLKPFIETYGKDMVNSFYKYWTQPNKSKTKFKQELEKTWELSYRLETWAKNDKNFVKPENNGEQPKLSFSK